MHLKKPNSCGLILREVSQQVCFLRLRETLQVQGSLMAGFGLKSVQGTVGKGL